MYGDVDKVNSFLPASGFLPRFTFQGCTRLAVKLDFIAGLLLKALELTGTGGLPRRADAASARCSPGATCSGACPTRWPATREPWIGGAVLPNLDYGLAYRMFMATGYPRVKEIIEQDVACGLIYLNSQRGRLQEPGDPALPGPVRARLRRHRRGRPRQAA